MAHLGLLLACDHFPDVDDDPARLDAVFRARLAGLGHRIDRVSVLQCHRGQIPAWADGCDLWVVSGAAPAGASAPWQAPLTRHIRQSLAAGVPVYAIYHGEHVLADALCASASDRPDTAHCPQIVRNPFRSFWGRDRIYAFSIATGRVEPVCAGDRALSPELQAA